MAAELPHHDPAARRILADVELTVGRHLDGVVHGDYQSLFPGPGTEPGESRLYVVGDDVRLIDWNVTARTTFPHVRDPVADHELDLWLLADVSASQHFGTARSEKRDVVVAAAAAFGIPATRLANRVGALVLTPTATLPVPARPGRNHLLAILARLLSAGGTEGGGRTDLAAAIGRLGRLAQRRGIVVVISDFLATPDWPLALGRLGTRHDLIAVEVLDPRELELPPVGILTLVDPETGTTRMVDTSRGRLRARYAHAAGEQRKAIAAAIRRAGGDHLVVRTDRDCLPDVARFFRLRRERLRGTHRPSPQAHR
jgi:uncharacterized protein (DUF58 family)